MDTETHAIITAVIALISALAAYFGRPAVDRKVAEVKAKRASQLPPAGAPVEVIPPSEEKKPE